jgi:hypothetical protein
MTYSLFYTDKESFFRDVSFLSTFIIIKLRAAIKLSTRLVTKVISHVSHTNVVKINLLIYSPSGMSRRRQHAARLPADAPEILFSSK